MSIFNPQVTLSRHQLNYLRQTTADSLVRTFYGIFRFLCIIVQNIYCVSTYLVLTWLIILPLSWVRGDLYSRVENYLYNSLLYIVSSWSIAAEIAIVETGDDYKQLIEKPETAYSNFSPKNNKIGLANGLNSSSSALRNFTTSSAGSHGPSSVSKENRATASDNHIGEKSAQDLSRLNSSNSNAPSSPSAIGLRQATSTSGNLGSDAKSTQEQTKGLAPSGDFNDACQTNSLSFLAPLIKRDVPRVLILCNHISTADVPLIMQSFSTLTRQSILWVLDAQFKPTNFGLVCASHGDFFVGKEQFMDGSLRDQVLKHPDRNLLVLFPEGGFWRKRLEGSNRYALKNGLPFTKYVTHPRYRAFKDLLDPSVQVTHIVDATLIYEDIKKPPSILNIALGNKRQPVFIHYRVFDRNAINPTEEWLRELWLDKDKLLQQYYGDRDSIVRRFETSMRSIRLDWVKIMSVHVSYILICYLAIYRLFLATGVTMMRARELYYRTI